MGNFCAADNTPQDYYSLIKRHASFKIPNLKHLNQYPQSNVQHWKQDSKIIIDEEAEKQFKGILQQLSGTNKQFTDQNFNIKGEVARLNRLDNRRMSPILLDQPDELNIIQNNDEFTYLSTVFCYIAEQKQIWEHLFCTRVNQHSFYVAKIFPNGEMIRVVVDNYVPIQRQRILYSSSKKAQIWMAILEKAWVKMIGSYEKARALSPEDAIQQILGIPAYSYQIATSNKDLEFSIQINKQKKACILFITKSDPSQLKNNFFSQQVFYLSGFQRIGNIFFYKLICPYDNFNFSGHFSSLQNQSARKYQSFQHNNRNMIFVTPGQICDYFSFCTFGYYKPGYVSRLMKISFEKEEGSKYFQFTVTKGELVNMRICQFYEGYVRQNQNYEYSSVYIRIWSFKTRQLISQGCDRAIYCVKSANVFPEIFKQLPPGQYFISIDIPWKFPESICQASIITYSQQPITFKQLDKLQGFQTQESFLSQSIPKQQIHQQQGFSYAIHWKRNSIFLYLKNLQSKPIAFKIDFKNIFNLIPLNHSFDKNILITRLQGLRNSLIEFRKIDINKQGVLGSFIFEII